MFNGMNGLEILKNWPRFDDGDPVEFGDEFQNAHGGASVLRTAIIKDCRDSLGGDFYWKLGKGRNAITLKSGERVKRPAPKVLDADGVEIRVGDTVWNSVGTALTVCAVNGDKSSFDAVRGYDEQKCPGLNPAIFTHRAPVLDADGKPLREGETVWKVDGTGPYEVSSIDGNLVKMDSGACINRCYLTHERPDSWERLEADAGKNPFDYCKDVGHRLDTCENSEAYKARDLVRRCKAFAERDR